MKHYKNILNFHNNEFWHIVKNMSKLNTESNFDEIEYEYEGALDDKRKHDSVKIQQNW